MKLNFKNAEGLLDGIAFVEKDLGITVTEDENADLIVHVVRCDERIVSVVLDGNQASIRYGDGYARFFRGLAILVDWVKNGENKNSLTETPTFVTNGAMFDTSKAVINVNAVKTMMRKMALMGMNMCMLYTEDTYEVEGNPYFGHMRGRYTKAELKELDAYGLKLGIELIPCIQVLGHLEKHLKWAAAGKYKDTQNALLVGADATYKLIEDMLETIKDCFTTRRVHVGMDETHDLGTGNYLDIHGFRERQDIFLEHMEKVLEMTRACGLEPMMWSDMFFRLAGKNLRGFEDYDPRIEFTDEVIAKIPKGIQQVFWDYYHPNEEFYTRNIEQHRRVFGENPIFAGGVWMWSGFCPLYSRSLKNTIPALEACKKNGVKEIMATLWCGSSEGSPLLQIAGLAWYADYDYKGSFDLESAKRCLKLSCGVDAYDALMNCELPEYPADTYATVSRALLYNDPLIGLADRHFEGMDLANYYKNLTEKLSADKSDKGMFSSSYDSVVKLASLFENKADFGIRLKKAYDAGDKETMRAMAEECDVITEKLNALKDAHQACWMECYKPFYWEVFDIRYGGLIARFHTVKVRINAYLNGDIDSIEELEEERLRLDCASANSTDMISGWFYWWGYSKYATANAL